MVLAKDLLVRCQDCSLHRQRLLQLCLSAYEGLALSEAFACEFLGFAKHYLTLAILHMNGPAKEEIQSLAGSALHVSTLHHI